MSITQKGGWKIFSATNYPVTVGADVRAEILVFDADARFMDQMYIREHPASDYSSTGRPDALNSGIQNHAEIDARLADALKNLFSPNPENSLEEDPDNQKTSFLSSLCGISLCYLANKRFAFYVQTERFLCPAPSRHKESVLWPNLKRLNIA